ncbi:14896_t:CDS:2, partial [Funneliformis geosporum]
KSLKDFETRFKELEQNNEKLLSLSSQYKHLEEKVREREEETKAKQERHVLRKQSKKFRVGKAYKERVEEIKNAQRGVSDQSARNQVYDDTKEHLPGGFTKDTLHKTPKGL